MLDLQFVRKELGWDTDNDQKLKVLIDEVIDLWESETRRHWKLRTDSIERFTRDDNQYIFFTRLSPLTAFSLVGWDKGEAEPDFSSPMVLSTDYMVDLEEGVFELLATPNQYYKAKVSGGYTADTLPRLVRAALIEQIKYDQIRFKPEVVANTSVGFDGGSSQLQNSPFHLMFKRQSNRLRRRFA